MIKCLLSQSGPNVMEIMRYNHLKQVLALWGFPKAPEPRKAKYVVDDSSPGHWLLFHSARAFM